MASVGIGQQLGNYRLVRRIGRGGMGEVFLAEHTSLPRPAAVKVLRPELCQDSAIVRRFFAEAQTASLIRHPGIVEIFDLDVANERAFIVMELLEGESLGSYLAREGSLRDDLPFVLALGTALAGAMGAAHEKGIVHRDLKPDNVQLHLAQRSEPFVTAKILDFGIAKLGHSAIAGQETITGAILGTPHYMSPEQCRGRGAIDSRSDIYSLGCILFEALSGSPVFDAQGAGDWIIAHISAPAPALASAVPGIPAALDSLVQRMLAKEPSDRPPSMGQVLAELQACGGALHLSLGSLTPRKRVRSALDSSIPDQRLLDAAEPISDFPRRAGRTHLLPNLPNVTRSESAAVPASSAPEAPPTPNARPRTDPFPFAQDTADTGPRPSLTEAIGLAIARMTGWCAGTLRASSRIFRRRPRPPTASPLIKTHRPAEPRRLAPMRRSAPQDRLTRVIAEALPPPLRIQQELITEFLSGPFAMPTELFPGVLRFGRVRLSAFSAHEFFCVFLAGATANQLGTRTFHSYVDPVSEYLAGLDRDIPKVVIAISDSALLGGGVKQRIVQFREDYGAIVVPIYIRDLKLAKRNGSVDRLLQAKLQEHSPPNYFHSAASDDVAGIFGAGDLLGQMIVQIKNRSRVLAVYAPPLSGKTSLINLAQESLQGTVMFSEVRCLERSSDNVADFVRSFTPDAADLASIVPIRAVLHRHVDAIVDEAAKDNMAATLVIEDADWLISVLVDGGIEDVQRKLAREFWSALAEIARLKRATLIVTGTRTHLLRNPRFFDWDSPVAGLVDAHRVPHLAPATLRDYLESKGPQMNVSYDAASIEAIGGLTSGQIYFIRRLCGRIVDKGKRADPLAAVRVTPEKVREAADELAGDITSFYQEFFQRFQPLEQQILSAIARKRPKTLASMAKRTARKADAEMVAALDAISALGLAERTNRGYAVTIPILREWILRNQLDRYPPAPQLYRTSSLSP